MKCPVCKHEINHPAKCIANIYDWLRSGGIAIKGNVYVWECPECQWSSPQRTDWEELLKEVIAISDKNT